jgi:hypothetical protein
MEQTWFGISNKTLYSLIAVILLLWGISGLQEITKTPYDGYLSSPDRVVASVRAGSPAAAAGLQVGDQITKFDGIAAENSAALAALPRRVAGSAGTLTVLRGGTEHTLHIRYGELPTTDLLLNAGAGILVGLASLILGLFVYLRNPTTRSSMLCLFLLAWAALFLPGPYLQSATVRGWLNALFQLIVGLTLALLLLYCLRFPSTKKILAERPWLSGLIVLIALVPGLIFAYRSIFQPETSAATAMTLSILGSVVLGGIFACSLWAIVHSYLKADANERKAWGLNWMMLGVVIGIAPLVLSVLLRLFIPRLGEMGWENLIGLSFLAIPLCFTLALMKREPVRHAIGEEARA